MNLNRSTLGGLAATGVAIVALAVGGPAVAGHPAGAHVNAQAGQTTQNAPRSANLVGNHDMHGMFSKVLHGEFVVAKAGGGYQSVLVQRGSVRTVSSTEITLRSADGFQQTYTVNDGTMVLAGRAGIGAVAKGDQVGVAAIKSGRTETAVHLADLSTMKSMWEKHGMPHMHR
jgi:hypothetical protein